MAVRMCTYACLNLRVFDINNKSYLVFILGIVSIPETTRVVVRVEDESKQRLVTSSDQSTVNWIWLPLRPRALLKHCALIKSTLALVHLGKSLNPINLLLKWHFLYVLPLSHKVTTNKEPQFIIKYLNYSTISRLKCVRI